MKIRSQLILAFVLLAVLPLSVLVVYSYHSSRQAVAETLAAEAWAMSAELQGRLDAVRDDLELHILQLGWMVEPGVEGEWVQRDKVRRLLEELGDTAHFLDAFEIVAVEELEEIELEEPVEGVMASAEDPAGLEVAFLELSQRFLLSEEGKVLEEMEVLEGLESAAAVAMALAAAFDHSVAIVLPSGVLPPDAPEAPTPEFSTPVPPAPQIEEARRRREERSRRLAESRHSTRMIFGRDLVIPLHRGGAEVGRLRAQVRADALLQEVLGRTLREEGEIPFAIDPEGKLYTAGEEDEAQLHQFPLDGLSAERPTWQSDHWVIATSEDVQSGLRFGIARPIDKAVAAIRLAAARNFVIGLGLIALAMLGILPFSNRITRNLHLVTAGAERIAAGDLSVRVPVRTRDEFGQLASTFNTMAQELSDNQERLLEEERRRLILAAENERKSRELEGARQLQLSLLPRNLPSHPGFELAVHMRTATEVGGDYYDFQLTEDGTLVVAVGDATGHGLRAGTLVTAIKSLFVNYHPESGPHRFLTDASATLRRLDLGRLAMALTLVELRGDELTIAAGGTPPILIHRADRGEVEELIFPGLPLGTPLPFTYHSHHARLNPGDTLLLSTDGFPELLDSEGDPLGYDRARELFQEAVERGGPQAIIEYLEAALDHRTGGRPPADDVTFVVLARSGGRKVPA